jgi:hypothetical protein
MEPVLLGLAGGAVGGALAGFLLSLFVSLGKDLRDARLGARGVRPPSDRVPVAYHWPFAAIGAVQAGLLAAGGVPPLWAALSILVIPALFLVFLVLTAPLALFVGGPRRRDFDPAALVGLEVTEATRLARENGWSCVRFEEPVGSTDQFRPPPRGAPGLSLVEIGVRDGKVTSARIV